MKIHSLLLPAGVLGAAAMLLVPTESSGFSVTGDRLPITQRDFRLFNNFTATTANNNATPDPNFPGYLGAYLSIWKACIEWGSELHGNGDGDSTQPFGLGSGGANFDCSWQGESDAVGNGLANVHSQISGCSGGVLAFTELPTSGGWRIRYYQCWTWQDGPGNVFSGIDLQGVAAHEYGHALGLGHTSSPGATMRGSISGTGVGARSIESDDIAGVQFIYGVKDPAKPRITGVSGSSVLSITGQNFSATDNEVWFTQGGTGGNGDPIKMVGLTSDGTLIEVPVPAGAGPGDVLVKKGGSSEFSALSNAWPVDPQPGPPCEATLYCTAKVNSIGQTPTLDFSGTPSLVINDFELSAFNGSLGAKNGIHFWSTNGPAAAPFFGGTLCAQPPVQRGAVHQYDAFGFLRLPLTVTPAMVGTTRWIQLWFRDPQHPDGTGVGLTSAIEVSFCN